MKRRLAIIMINAVVGLFAAYVYACYVRETEIQSTQDNITCDIVELNLKHSSRQHPSAKIIYRGKEYYTAITINLTDSLSLGENNTVFYYDGVLDRVFCRDSGIERGVYLGFAFLFCLSYFGSIPKIIKKGTRKLLKKSILIISVEIMSRLGVLYALKDDELNKLRSLPQAERYDYMLEEIEESLLDTPRGCELDKAWDGIQYCLGGGAWKEENSIPTNIVLGGEFLVETEDEIITLKSPSDVIQIVDYLHQNNLKEIIRKNFHLIEEQEYSLPKNDDTLEYLLGWSEGIQSFYENALQEGCSVIFTVDW